MYANDPKKELLRRIAVAAVSVSIAAACIASVLLFAHDTSQNANMDDEVEQAIKQLWSEDDVVRLEAKKKLIEYGSPVIKPLIALLEDLISNPHPRYVTGKESEGEEAMKQLREHREGSLHDDALARLMKISIGGRLKTDVCELLGHLRAKEAVPILIRDLESQEISDMIPGMTPVMHALADIGPEAVPQLIESLERAEATAASSPAALSTESDTEAKARILKMEATRIQVNIVLILEKMGDKRALPSLENLLNKSQNEFLTKLINKTITEIKAKAN